MRIRRDDLAHEQDELSYFEKDEKKIWLKWFIKHQQYFIFIKTEKVKILHGKF